MGCNFHAYTRDPITMIPNPLFSSPSRSYGITVVSRATGLPTAFQNFDVYGISNISSPQSALSLQVVVPTNSNHDCNQVLALVAVEEQQVLPAIP